jgi:hypothetical protein
MPQRLLLRSLKRVGSVACSFANGILVPREQRPRTIFSFIVDEDPKFAYEGYHLARSLLLHCCDDPADVHVQFTPEVKTATRNLFLDLGCSEHEIQRFGDGRHCNKVGQLANLQTYQFEKVVLLDTDTIALADFRPHLNDKALMAKVVDLPNPSVTTLETIARKAGMPTLPPLVTVDAAERSTYLANCNGGFYSIPKALCQQVDTAWRFWSCWLLDNIEPLRREGKEVHVDQVSLWLAIHMERIPYRAARSNLNYYLHFTGEHRNFDPKGGIALIHYHDTSINPLGLISPMAKLNEVEKLAVRKANEQIVGGFESRTYWHLGYSPFLEQGSGVGSRAANLMYKRQLLIDEGVEQAQSVLDVGCGDLEVVKTLGLRDYLGLDPSAAALEVARRARPEWEFRQFEFQEPTTAIPTKQLVLCFDALMYQRTEAEYRALVDFLASRAEQTLLVSGYDRKCKKRPHHSMQFFYEPLEESLRQTRKFSSIRGVGAHSDASIYRCDV